MTDDDILEAMFGEDDSEGRIAKGNKMLSYVLLARVALLDGNAKMAEEALGLTADLVCETFGLPSWKESSDSEHCAPC